jgi:hypothetical protein
MACPPVHSDDVCSRLNRRLDQGIRQTASKRLQYRSIALGRERTLDQGRLGL